MIRNILWDLDGTLFDTYPGIASAFQAAFLEFKAEIPYPLLFDLSRVSFRHCLETVCAQTGLPPDPVYTSFLAHYAAIPLDSSPPFPGAREVCAEIHARGGKNIIVTHRGAESTRRLVSAHTFNGLIDGIVGGDEGFPRKPAPDAFQAALARWQLDPAESLAAGDRDLDLQAGKAAGLVVAAFGPGPFTEKADFYTTDLRELLAWL